jgi:hypothetical protein
MLLHSFNWTSIMCWTVKNKHLFSQLSVFQIMYKICTFPCICWLLLWSSGQSSWLQVQRSGFDSRLYQIFWVVVGLERGPLSLVSTIDPLLGRKSSGSGLENRDYGHRDPPRWPHDTPLSTKVGKNFTDKRWLLGWYSWHADYRHGVTCTC